MVKLAALTLGVLSVAAVAVACGGGEDRPGTSGSASATASGSSAGDETPAFSENDADTVVDVTLKEFEFAGIPATIKGDKVFFDAKNAGTEDHELEIVDAKGDDVDEIPAFEKGETKQLAVELEPGTYTVQCLLKEGSKTHADLGMKTTFTVE